MNLTEIADKHNAKISDRTHNYWKAYETLFQHRRNNPLTFVEIGVYEGASLEVWKEYFPNGRVIGIDCNEEYINNLRTRGFEVYIADQKDLNRMLEVTVKIGSIDIICDDAGHTSQPQQKCFEVLWPLINPGGFYSIEDLWNSYKQKRIKGGSTVEYMKAVIDTAVMGLPGAWKVKKMPRLDKQRKDFPKIIDLDSIHFYNHLVVLGKNE